MLTRSLFPVFALAAALGLDGAVRAQPNPYYRAGYARMFNASGTYATSLDPGAPPVLGAFTSLTINAPQAILGVLVMSPAAQAGILLPFPQPIEFFLDPMAPLTTFHRLLPSERTLTFQVPQNQSLVGMNVAFQAFSACGLTDLSATNLVIANLGLSPYSGLMQFRAQVFGPLPIGGNQYMKVADGSADKMVFKNDTAASLSVTLTITVNPVSAGPVQIRQGNDGNYAVIGEVPAGQSPLTVKVTLAAGTQMFFYNNSSTDIAGVTWTIDSVR